MKQLPMLGLLLAPFAFAACTSGDLEDGANDDFLAEGGKADAFGVEDWSPDGWAVLRLASTARLTTLDDKVGLSARVARNIVDGRARLADGTYQDLRELDLVPYVGPAVFEAMRAYVTEKKMFRTAIRLPLVATRGDEPVLLSSFNAEAAAAEQMGFATYTYASDETDWATKMDRYDERLAALATATGSDEPAEMLRWVGNLDEFAVAGTAPCYIGDPTEVAAALQGQGGNVTSEMYWIWGWRAGVASHVDEAYADTDADESFGDAWSSYDTSSDVVAIFSSANDGGDVIDTQFLPPCR